jgi:hypothetical protein
MTTVVACQTSRSMVADSRIMHGDVSFSTGEKAFKVGKFLVGVSGEFDAGLEFVATFRKAVTARTTKAPSIPGIGGSFDALVLSPLGMWLYSDSGVPIPIQQDVYAIGTGGSAALAVAKYQEMLGSPADIESAARCAIEVNPSNSGLPLTILSL